MKDDLVSRLLAKNRDSGHPVIWHLNNPDGPEAVAALKARDAEIARYREALGQIRDCTSMHGGAAIALRRIRQALQDTDNG